MSIDVDQANTQFIYLRSEAGGEIQYDAGGFAWIMLDPTSGQFLDIAGYRQLSVWVSAQNAVACTLMMGTISGETAAQAFPVPVDGNIHTFNVQGPEMALYMNGPANAQDQIQLWVFLRS